MPSLFWLFVSIGLHIVIIIVVVDGNLWDREEPSRTVTLKTGLIEERMEDPQENPIDTLPPPPIPTPESSIDRVTPVRYTGAPDGVEDVERVEDTESGMRNEKPEIGKGPSLEELASSSHMTLARADRLIEEGENLPGYAVTNLDNETISRIMEADRGRVIGMCERNMDLPRVLVNWGTQGPEGYRVALADKWIDGLSERAIELPGYMENWIRREVKKELGLGVGSVMLFLDHELDRLILSSQISACVEEGIEIKEVRKTVGRLTFGETGIGNYRVESFELKDGAIRLSHSPRISNGVEFENEEESDRKIVVQSTTP